MNISKIFYDFSNVLSAFLDERLRQSKLPGFDYNDPLFTYKYASIRFRNYDPTNDLQIKHKNSYITADLILTRNSIYLLTYINQKRKFELIYYIPLKNLVKLSTSKVNNNCLVIFFENNMSDHSIEIKSESYASLLALIDDLYNDFKDKL
jgi:hypothetical protein